MPCSSLCPGSSKARPWLRPAAPLPAPRPRLTAAAAQQLLPEEIVLLLVLAQHLRHPSQRPQLTCPPTLRHSAGQSAESTAVLAGLQTRHSVGFMLQARTWSSKDLAPPGSSLPSSGGGPSPSSTYTVSSCRRGARG